MKMSPNKNTIHGHSRKGMATSEYRTWAHIKNRCGNSKYKEFHRYGERGIKVCERWLNSFPNFLADMGLKPTASHSIERKNNNGDYEPNNCIWATDQQQSENRRSNRFLTHDGKTMIMSHWAKLTGISSNKICQRLKKGWAIEKTLTFKRYPFPKVYRLKNSQARKDSWLHHES